MDGADIFWPAVESGSGRKYYEVGENGTFSIKMPQKKCAAKYED
jgi:hypothetical protein